MFMACTWPKLLLLILGAVVVVATVPSFLLCIGAGSSSSRAEKIVKLRDPFGVALSFGTCGNWTMMYHFRAIPLENCIVVHRCHLSLSTLLSNRFR